MEIKMPPIMSKGANTVGTIEVTVGQLVTAGQVLANVETGKGNRPIKCGSDGRILDILCKEGDQVVPGQDLFLFEEVSAADLPKEPVKADLFILGGGPGGYVAALYAAKHGLSVALAERDLLGGTCLNRGCIPTKALIQSAQLREALLQSAAFGVTAGEIKVDEAAIFQRKSDICAELRQGVEGLLEGSRVAVIPGHARLTGQGTALVTDGDTQTEVHFTDAILATGSVPARPPIVSLPETVMDSDRALSAGRFPQSIVLIGGGVIGMEFAFLYRAMGAQVYVVEYQDHILGSVDADVSDTVAQAARNKGIEIYTSAKITNVRRAESAQTLVTFEQEGVERILVAESVLTATGRRPVTQNLGLEELGVALTSRGFVDIDETMATNVPHLYAIGDVTGKLALAHAASHQGIAAVDAIRGTPRKMDYDAVPSVIFTHPEVACVGKTERACAEEGIPVVVSKFPFGANGKAKIMGQTEGFVKLLRHAETRRLLGGAVVGPDASALISTIATAVKSGLTDLDLSDVVFAHPTTAEAIYEADLGLGVGMLHYQS